MAAVSGVVGAVLVRLVLGALVWWGLVEGDGGMVAYGAVIVPVGVALSLWVTGVRTSDRRRRGPRPGALLGLLGWLLARAAVGGVDVARRAVTVPAVDVEPVWETYETALESPGARVVLALVMNLLPGTLSARIDGPRIAVHVISRDLEVGSTLRDLEDRLRRAGAH